MTDISKEAVERLVKDMSNRQKMRTVGVHIVQHVSETLRAQAARIAELEADREALITARDMMGRKWATARDDALRAAIAICDAERQGAVDHKLPQMALGALACKRAIQSELGVQIYGSSETPQ